MYQYAGRQDALVTLDIEKAAMVGAIKNLAMRGVQGAKNMASRVGTAAKTVHSNNPNMARNAATMGGMGAGVGAVGEMATNKDWTAGSVVRNSLMGAGTGATMGAGFSKWKPDAKFSFGDLANNEHFRGVIDGATIA